MPNTPPLSPRLTTSFPSPTMQTPTGTPQRSPSISDAVEQLGDQLTQNSPHAMRLPTTGVTPVAPIERSARGDDIQTFSQGKILYRGDNSFKPTQADNYRAQFYTEHPEVARENYGNLVVQMKTNQELKLIRLDQYAEGFLTWLGHTDRFSDQDKAILHTHYGYPRPNSAESQTQEKRNRLSEGVKDRTMVQMIQAYAQETQQTIHGYYIDTMNKVESRTGNKKEASPTLFHAEFVVCDPAHVDSAQLIRRYSSDEIEAAHTEDKMVRMKRSLEEQRRENIMSRADRIINRPPSPDNDSSDDSPAFKHRRLF